MVLYVPAANGLPVAPAHIDALTALLPALEAPGFRPTEGWVQGELSPGVQVMPHPIYTDTVRALQRHMHHRAWRDTEYGRFPIRDWLDRDDAIEQATVEQLRAMLTFAVRGERFADGHIESLLNRGVLQRIIRRLGQLRQEVEARCVPLTMSAFSAEDIFSGQAEGTPESASAYLLAEAKERFPTDQPNAGYALVLPTEKILPRWRCEATLSARQGVHSAQDGSSLEICWFLDACDAPPSALVAQVLTEVSWWDRARGWCDDDF